MRTYVITPCYRTLNDGTPEQQGYDVTCSFGRWKASHGAVELCETAVLKREQMRSTDRRKQQIYGKDYQIIYKNCKSEAGIIQARLELYQ